MKKSIVCLLVFGILLSGCGVLEDPKPATTAPSQITALQQKPEVTPPTVEVDFAQTDADMFTGRDEEDTYSKGTMIQLDGNSVTCNSAAVKVEGTKITIGKEGVYILRGTLNDGQILVNAGDSDKVQLVLEGASITGQNTPALNVEAADKVFLTLAAGTENVLSNGGSFGNSGADGAVFSRADLSFNGTGSLTVESPAGHGIVCKDDLVVAGGSFQIHAASHALDANDSFRMKGASLKVDAGKDGIHVEDNDDSATGFVYISGGSLIIEAEGDGISAGYWMQISNGSFDILAGGGYENGVSHSSGGWGDFMGGGRPGPRAAATAETADSDTSMKGLKAKGGMLISGGDITIDAADDGLHSDGAVTVSGGNIKIASGDDGIHGETNLRIAGGEINITNGYEGLEAQNVHVIGGQIRMVCTDDGINAAGGRDSSGTGGRDEMFSKPGGPGDAANGSIVIDGGDMYIQSSGDGMDANGYLEINGGKTVICGPNSGDTATLDFETTGSINGGIFVGTGSSFMAQTFSENTQGVLAVQAGQGQSGVTITVSDKDGKELVSFQPELPFSVIIFSTPELISGQTYHITIGDKEADLEAY